MGVIPNVITKISDVEGKVLYESSTAGPGRVVDPNVLAQMNDMLTQAVEVGTGKGANPILAVLGVIYSIPSLALFVALPVLLGTRILDPVNVAVALTIYSVALLVRSVVDGLRSVPDSVKQSASAVGFGGLRRFVAVELPLAMPVIFAGLRVVTVSNIALVSIGVLIGVQQLGQLFDTGFNRSFYTPIVVGIVLTVVLALIADAIILLIQRGALPWARGKRVA